MHARATISAIAISRTFKTSNCLNLTQEHWELERKFTGQFHNENLYPAKNPECECMFGWLENKSGGDAVVSWFLKREREREREREQNLSCWRCPNSGEKNAKWILVCKEWITLFARRERKGLCWRQKVRRHVK